MEVAGKLTADIFFMKIFIIRRGNFLNNIPTHLLAKQLLPDVKSGPDMMWYQNDGYLNVKVCVAEGVEVLFPTAPVCAESVSPPVTGVGGGAVHRPEQLCEA